MKRFNVALALGVAMLFATCNETKEDASNPLSERDVYRTIGEEIPFETGMQWMDFYQRGSTTGRLDSLGACKVPAYAMKAMLSSVENLVGVAFHYAIDDFGRGHILLIPVNETMQLWSTTPGRLMIDAATGLEISQDRAQLWAENYKALHPTDIWYHFFGKDIFDQMQALPYFESVDIEPATNPDDLSAQLLLIIWNDGQISTGRTTTVPATVYDASNACPPCATK
ncbi:MAG TPA: hypothetical protein VFT90_01755 [Chryseosolibacter sp.]|nr:hypothetical protein [Chryseosolibacter sp.]